MASPFSIFRKHQKWLMAAVTLFAMFAFVAINPFSGSGGGARQGAQEQTTLATWKFGKITREEVANRLAWRRRLNQFIAMLEQASGRQPGGRRFQENEDDVLRSIVMAKKAELLGMTVNNRSINDYLDSATGGVLDTAKKGACFNEISRGSFSEDQLFDALRFELMARNFAELVVGDAVEDGTPYQRWDYFSRLNRLATIQVVPVDVKDFLAQVPDPSEDKLKAFFEEHKEQQARPDSPVPGFREPVRAKFDYFKGDQATFAAAAKSKVTDAEIKTYYDAHKEDFRKSALDDLPKTTAPLTGTEKPKATEPKATEPTVTGPNVTGPKATAPTITPPKATEPAKVPEPLKATDPAKAPEPNKTPEKTSTPEPAKAPEPPKTPDAAKTPEPAKTPELPKADPTSKTDDKPKSDDKSKTDTKPSDKSDNKSSESLRGRILGADEELLALADPAPEPPKKDDSAKPSATPPETPKVDPPKTDAPKPDAPKTDAPKTEPPKVEPPKTEPVKSEPAKSEPLKSEPSKTEPAKAEPPKVSPPKAEPPKAEPPKSETPKREPPKKTTPDDHSPANYSPPTASATGTKIPIVEYDPVDNPKVRDTIVTELAREKGSKVIDDAFKKLSAKVSAYDAQLSRFRIKNVIGDKPPEPPDFQDMGKEFGVEFRTTGMLSPEEVNQTPLGKSGQLVFGGRAVHSFVELAYDPNQKAYRADQTTTLDGESEILWWRTKYEPSYVPKFEDVRAKVLNSFKMVEARKLATAKAAEYAAEANKAHKTFKDLFQGKANLTPREIGPFSWLSRPNTPTFPGQMTSFALTKLSGVDDAGPDFMRTVFDLDPGSAGEAMNQPKTVAYALQLQNIVPGESAIRSEFLSQLAIPYGDPSRQAAFASANVTFATYLKSIEDDFDFKRVAGVAPIAGSEPMGPMDSGGGDEED